MDTFQDEIFVDVFCGGGGASVGIEAATGKPPFLAINHDPEAIRMHWLNHPHTHHLTEDVWLVDPIKATHGRLVGGVWFSPNCTHFSAARGDKPMDHGDRSLADVVHVWIDSVHPRMIFLENVIEFEKWGPLNKHNRPIKAREGELFTEWVRKIESAGYVVEWRRLTASDYGVPTSRERLFLVARCDGEPIIWPSPTNGTGLFPVRPAAECMDFNLPCPSIFMDSKEAWNRYRARRPLKEKTMARIAAGLKKFVLDTPKPFIVDNKAMFLSKYHGARGTEPDGRGQSLHDPLLTLDTQNRFALVTAWLMKYYGTNIGSDLRQPVPTVTGQGNHLALVQAFLTKYYGCGIGQSLDEPLGTLTTKDRFGVVVVIRNQQYLITDIGLRMLTPTEALKAMGFPDEYVLVGTKSNMTRRIGNSVPPHMAEIMVRANYVPRNIKRKAVG